MAAAGTVLTLLLVACNPDLLPLAPLVDALRLDAMALMLAAQLVATFPWLHAHPAASLRVMGHTVVGLLADFAGGCLRALQFGLREGTGGVGRAR